LKEGQLEPQETEGTLLRVKISFNRTAF